MPAIGDVIDFVTTDIHDKDGEPLKLKGTVVDPHRPICRGYSLLVSLHSTKNAKKFVLTGSQWWVRECEILDYSTEANLVLDAAEEYHKLMWAIDKLEK